MIKCLKILITGGTGSFGNAVLERFLNIDIKEIHIFSKKEGIEYLSKSILKLYNSSSLRSNFAKNGK